MKNKENEEEVINTLRNMLTNDGQYPYSGHDRSDFEMTRKKSRYGVSEFFADECSHCHGRGGLSACSIFEIEKTGEHGLYRA